MATAARPVIVPIGAGDSFRGVVDVLSRKAYLEDGTESDVTDDMGVDVESYREQVIEAAAEADDDLATKYLGGRGYLGRGAAYRPADRCHVG